MPNGDRTKVVRACGAVIRDYRILMVQHKHDGREYWTLPGGSVEPNETPGEAAVGEVKEETGLEVEVKRPLLDEDFGGDRDACRCFLTAEVLHDQETWLGRDPEQAHVLAKDRMLQGVSWHTLDAVKYDKQVSRVIDILKIAVKGA